MYAVRPTGAVTAIITQLENTVQVQEPERIMDLSRQLKDRQWSIGEMTSCLGYSDALRIFLSYYKSWTMSENFIPSGPSKSGAGYTT